MRPGRAGNVATEDVAYLLRGMGIETGVDPARLIETGRCFIIPLQVTA